MLVSFQNSADPEMRNFAAFAVSELSRNSDMMGIITDEGGLEPVLYLARSDDKRVQRQGMCIILIVLLRSYVHNIPKL